MSAPASSSWVFSFEIPGRFTNKTMKCLEDVCISSTARSEIIGSLHTRMLQYTDFPSPFEYRARASCRRLVEKYPCLVDKTESGYVSNTYTIAYVYYSEQLLLVKMVVLPSLRICTAAQNDV